MAKRLILTLLFVAVILLFMADLLLGSVPIPPGRLLATLLGHDGGPYEAIVFQLRLPRALTALMAGAALSVSGLLMQNVFRNPLAGPYVLGVSAGASLGVALVVMGISAGLSMAWLSGFSLTLAAWTGAGLTLALIALVSVRVRDVMTILILGVLFGSGVAALISLLQYFSGESTLKAYVIWTMGSLGGVARSDLWMLIPVTALGLISVLIICNHLNIMQLGEEHARGLGMNVNRVRNLIFLITSLLAGTITAYCGPIGFIGIAAPHISRMLFRTADHRILGPGAMLTGSLLMLIADIASQAPGSERVLPINSITALTGIPIIIWVIIKNRKFVAVS